MRILDEHDFEELTTFVGEEDIHSGRIDNVIFTAINQEKLYSILKGHSDDSAKGKKCYRGKIEFNHCSFNDLNLSEKYMEENVVFRDCLFQGNVNCSNTEFLKDVSFDGSVFMDDVNFNDAVFHRIASFERIHLLPKAAFNCHGNVKKWTQQYYGSTKLLFRGAVFEGPVDFQYRQFPQFTSFEEAVFKNYFVFDNVDFRSGTTFAGAKYECISQLNEGILDPIQLQICFTMLRKSAEKARWSRVEIERIRNIEDNLEQYKYDGEYDDIKAKIYTSEDNPCLPNDKGFIRKDAVLKYTGWQEDSLDPIASKHPDNFKRFWVGNVLYFEFEPLREYFIKKNYSPRKKKKTA